MRPARLIGGVCGANAFAPEGVKSQFCIDIEARTFQFDIDTRLQTSAGR
jgi:hypothetical protein